jgi:uracil-DNA glycosylase
MTTGARSAADFIPPRPTLAALKRAAAHCRGCDLWKQATQTVFGEGPATATLMLVGEQPGDQEDRVGRPFVGPAGRLLDEGLAAALRSEDEDDAE